MSINGRHERYHKRICFYFNFLQYIFNKLKLKCLGCLTCASELATHRGEVLWHWVLNELLLLGGHESGLLLLVQQSHALHLAHVAHVAGLSEGEVVVEASLAGPVTDSFGVAGLLVFLHLVELDWAVFVGHSGLVLSYFLASLLEWLGHVFWLSIVVVGGLGLLASEASFSSLEVVVLALVALPSAVWEHEASSLKLTFLFGALFFFKWLDTFLLCSRLGVFLELRRGLHGWEENLRVLVELFIDLVAKVVDSDVVDSLWSTAVLTTLVMFSWNENLGWLLFISAWRIIGISHVFTCLIVKRDILEALGEVEHLVRVAGVLLGVEVRSHGLWVGGTIIVKHIKEVVANHFSLSTWTHLWRWSVLGWSLMLVGITEDALTFHAWRNGAELVSIHQRAIPCLLWGTVSLECIKTEFLLVCVVLIWCGLNCWFFWWG